MDFKEFEAKVAELVEEKNTTDDGITKLLLVRKLGGILQEEALKMRLPQPAIQSLLENNIQEYEELQKLHCDELYSKIMNVCGSEENRLTSSCNGGGEYVSYLQDPKYYIEKFGLKNYSKPLPSNRDVKRCVEEFKKNELEKENQKLFSKMQSTSNQFVHTPTIEENFDVPSLKNDFHSGLDELKIQQKRKNFMPPSSSMSSSILKNSNESSSSTPHPLFNYGASKKSLGMRRQFVPPITNTPSSIQTEPTKTTVTTTSDNCDERLKNIDPDLIEIIRSEIKDNSKPITFDDISGLDIAKQTIDEAVIFPMHFPELFEGLRQPVRGILLFGPPGTGKTLLGKCIASQSHSTFFNISASSLTSKWIGESEKLVRALFTVAVVEQPSVIFIDEIDSLLSARKESEHESSRRLKTEFFVQLDGIGTGDEDRVLIVGATNRPQELDDAARRRFVKRLYIPLPEYAARIEILRNLIRKERHSMDENDLKKIGEMTEGYSGADIKSLSVEASMGPVRSARQSMKFEVGNKYDKNCVPPITLNDFLNALKKTRASVSPQDLEQYITWNETYGSG